MNKRQKLFWVQVSLVFGAALIFSLSSCGRKEMADLILINGTVWTGKTDKPWAEAVAIKGDRILAVGTSEEIRKLVRGKTGSSLDLNQALVLPGFTDSHTHFLEGGLALGSIQLKDAASREEFIARVASQAKKLGPGKWITQGNWDHQQFDPPELPQKEWIDPVTRENPVLISRHDGHMALANSLALSLAKITRETASPPGGEIQKNPLTGEPTGILTDAAIELVSQHVPEPAFAEKVAAAREAVAHAVKYGVTSVHDMGEVFSLEVYEELWRQHELNCRVFLYIPITAIDLWEKLSQRPPSNPDFLRLAGLKGFVDGSLGAATALFFEPYLDQPQNCGLLHNQMYPEGIMEERIRRADQMGLQVAIHAIGDRANSLILDIFEKIMAENGPRERRFRVEHAQHLKLPDMERMARLGVIASVQPYHLADDGRWAERRIGPERARTTYAFRSLLRSGVKLAAGSDWTVAPLDPLTGIWAAVTRQTVDGQHPQGWVPEEKITVEEAVRAYTLGGAYAGFVDDKKGTVEPGKWADLVVLDKNIFTLPADKILEARVLMTIVGGRVVYNAEE